MLRSAPRPTLYARMEGALTRLKTMALRRLWTEDPGARARRRCRTLTAAPFAALAGLTWGVFSAAQLATGSALFWGVLGGVALPVLMYVEQRLAPFLFELAHRRWGAGKGGLVGASIETAVVAGFLYWITRIVGAPTVPQMGTALGIGAFYAFIMEYIVCGPAAAHATALLQGTSTVAGARHDGGSRADALAARGDHPAAIAAYEASLERRPRDPSLYTRLANILVAAGEAERAVEVLRRGFRKADLSENEEAFVVRRIVEICETNLGSLALAEVDLHELLERQPDSPHAAWVHGLLDLLDPDRGKPGRQRPAPTPPVG